MKGQIVRFALGVLLLALSLQAEMIAVIDNTPRPLDGVRDQLMDYIVDAIRTRARDCLSTDYNVLTRETTLAILSDSEIDPTECIGSCTLEMARALAADYLVSTQFIVIADRIHLQMILFRTADGLLMGSEELVAQDESALVNQLPEYTARLYARIDVPVASFSSKERNSIELTSSPPGAAVYVNQDYFGTTPLTLELPRGRQQFKFSLAGYLDAEQQLQLVRDTSLCVDLLSAFATVSIRSTPTGQPVLVDGNAQGVTPLLALALSPGQHRISVGEQTLYYPNEQALFLTRGEHRELQMDPVLRAGACELNAHGPDGALSATVYVDGQEVGQTPFRGQLPVGRHDLRVLGHSERVQVSEGKALVLNWELSHKDGVEASLNSTPSGARVYLDDEYLGRTPLECRHLPGTYKLRLLADDHEELIRDLQWYEGGRYSYKLQTYMATVAVLVRKADSSWPVHVDGRQVGSTPWEGELGIGRHRLRVGRYESSITLKAGEREQLTLSQRQVLPTPPVRSGWYFGIGSPVPQWKDEGAIEWHHDEHEDEEDSSGEINRLLLNFGMLWQSPRWQWEFGYVNYRMDYDSAADSASFCLRWGALDASLHFRLPLSHKDPFRRFGWQLGLGGGVMEPVHNQLRTNGEKDHLEMKDPLYFLSGMLGYYSTGGMNLEFGYRSFSRELKSVPVSSFKPNCWFLRLSFCD